MRGLLLREVPSQRSVLQIDGPGPLILASPCRLGSSLGAQKGLASSARAGSIPGICHLFGRPLLLTQSRHTISHLGVQSLLVAQVPSKIASTRRHTKASHPSRLTRRVSARASIGLFFLLEHHQNQSWYSTYFVLRCMHLRQSAAFCIARGCHPTPIPICAARISNGPVSACHRSLITTR